jgi:acylphosphatase
MEKIARRYFVSGRVQGVGYRYFAQRAASHLKLAGWVRNLSDGRVEAYAVGAEAVLEVFEAKLQEGPHASRVTDVIAEVAGVDATIEGFQIR